MHRPAWFKDGQVVVSTARTSGINKDGNDLWVVDEATGTRTDVVNNELRDDVAAVLKGEVRDSVQVIPMARITDSGVAVPTYYDQRYLAEFRESVAANWPDFESRPIGELVDAGLIEVTKGHGSPSQDLRTGTIPYIKVSDLRAGQVNINPTNMVSDVVARRFWRGADSGLRAFDLLSPERASKNIGDFCVLMPGQERLVLTREILVFRPGSEAQFDAFYLLWALTLSCVRNQWNRIVLMQTNREDVGKRYLEIEIPIAPTQQRSDDISRPFRAYFMGMADLRDNFQSYLNSNGQHHFHLGVQPEEDPAGSD